MFTVLSSVSVVVLRVMGITFEPAIRIRISATVLVQLTVQRWSPRSAVPPEAKNLIKWEFSFVDEVLESQGHLGGQNYSAYE